MAIRTRVTSKGLLQETAPTGEISTFIVEVPTIGVTGAPVWPGVPEYPGVGSSASIVIPVGNNIDSVAVFSVQLPGSMTTTQFYANDMQDGYTGDKTFPENVQINRTTLDALNDETLPFTTQFGQNSDITFTLRQVGTAGNGAIVTRGVDPYGNPQPLTLPGSSSFAYFSGGTNSTPATILLQAASNDPVVGWLFDVQLPMSMGSWYGRFYSTGNSDDAFTPTAPPALDKWINVSPTVKNNLERSGLPLDWTAVVLSGSLTITMTAQTPGTSGDGGTISVQYPAGTGDSQFSGGVDAVPGVPSSTYPAGTSTGLAANVPGDLSPVTSSLTLGTDNGFLKRTGAGTTDDAVSSVSIFASDVQDFASASVESVQGAALTASSLRVDGEATLSGPVTLSDTTTFMSSATHSGSLIFPLDSPAEITADYDDASYTTVDVGGKFVVVVSASNAGSVAGANFSGAAVGQLVMLLNAGTKPIMFSGFANGSHPVLDSNLTMFVLRGSSAWYAPSSSLGA